LNVFFSVTVSARALIISCPFLNPSNPQCVKPALTVAIFICAKCYYIAAWKDFSLRSLRHVHLPKPKIFLVWDWWSNIHICRTSSTPSFLFILTWAGMKAEKMGLEQKKQYLKQSGWKNSRRKNFSVRTVRAIIYLSGGSVQCP
jgi:hypothetical protein